METKMDDPRVDDAYSDSHPQLTTLTAPSTTTSVMDMPTYSQVTAAVSSYAHDLHSSGHPTHYYSEFDWQHGSAAAASDPSHGSFYSLAERPDLASVQLYHTFPSAVPHTDIYSASPTLWHGPPGLLEDSSHAGALASQRFLPGMPRASPSSATSPSSTSSLTTSSGKPKRRRVQSLTQRKAANIRERRRMFHLNTAFDELRKRLPAFNYEKRLSRIETLRLAMTYIGFMKVRSAVFSTILSL